MVTGLVGSCDGSPLLVSCLTMDSWMEANKLFWLLKLNLAPRSGLLSLWFSKISSRGVDWMKLVYFTPCSIWCWGPLGWCWCLLNDIWLWCRCVVVLWCWGCWWWAQVQLWLRCMLLRSGVRGVRCSLKWWWIIFWSDSCCLLWIDDSNEALFLCLVRRMGWSSCYKCSVVDNKWSFIEG